MLSCILIQYVYKTFDILLLLLLPIMYSLLLPGFLFVLTSLNLTNIM